VEVSITAGVSVGAVRSGGSVSAAGSSTGLAVHVVSNTRARPIRRTAPVTACGQTGAGIAGDRGSFQFLLPDPEASGCVVMVWMATDPASLRRIGGECDRKISERTAVVTGDPLDRTTERFGCRLRSPGTRNS